MHKQQSLKIMLRFAAPNSLRISSMLEKLKNKWKVTGFQLLLIICTFAIGGSICGYAGRAILSKLPIDKGVLWVVVYVVLISLLWPLSVLLVSIPFGQFRFFKNYLSRVAKKLGIIKK